MLELLTKKVLIDRKYEGTSIYLFKVRCNDHLVNYFPLIYRHGININILHLTISRAEFYSFRIVFLSLQNYLMKKQTN